MDKENITSYLNSNAMWKYLMTMYSYMLRSNKFKIPAKKNYVHGLAATDGKDIMVSMANIIRFFPKSTKDELVDLVAGVIGHEIGHILYTRNCILEINNNEIAYKLKSDERGTFLQLKNALEDGRVEYLALHMYKGTCKMVLNILREKLNDKNMFTITNAESEYGRKISKSSRYLSLLLYYVRTLDIPKVEKELNDLFTEIKEDVKRAITTAEELQDDLVYKVYLNYKKYADDILESDEKELQGNQNGENENAEAFKVLKKVIQNGLDKGMDLNSMCNGKEDDKKNLDNMVQKELLNESMILMSNESLVNKISGEVPIKIIRPINSLSCDNFKESDIVAKRTAKVIKEILREESFTNKKQYSYTGKKFLAQRSSRTDLKYFNKKSEDQDNGLSVIMRVDLSGSMGKRTQDLKNAIYLLYKICRYLSIPVGIYGDNADKDNCLIYPIIDIESNNVNDELNISGITTQSNNRDEISIEFVTSKLEKENSSKKLCFIISDGLPLGGKSAIEKIKKVVAQGEKKGIKYIAIGLGECQKVMDIYGKDKFININDTKEFPLRLKKLLKNELLN